MSEVMHFFAADQAMDFVTSQMLPFMTGASFSNIVEWMCDCLGIFPMELMQNTIAVTSFEFQLDFSMYNINY